MDIKNILYPALSLGGLGLIFGVILGYAADKFKVEVNPKISKIRDILPGANCGACGFAGCDACAAAIVEGEAQSNACPVAGENVAVNISEILGVEVKKEAESETAADEDGTSAKKALKCVGCGLCAKVCPKQTIEMVEKRPIINFDNCVGCKLCIKKCPTGVMEQIYENQKKSM